jgi:hypothetical protein
METLHSTAETLRCTAEDLRCTAELHRNAAYQSPAAEELRQAIKDAGMATELLVQAIKEATDLRSEHDLSTLPVPTGRRQGLEAG